VSGGRALFRARRWCSKGNGRTRRLDSGRRTLRVLRTVGHRRARSGPSAGGCSPRSRCSHRKPLRSPCSGHRASPRRRGKRVAGWTASGDIPRRLRAVAALERRTGPARRPPFPPCRECSRAWDRRSPAGLGPPRTVFLDRDATPPPPSSASTPGMPLPCVMRARNPRRAGTGRQGAASSPCSTCSSAGCCRRDRRSSHRWAKNPRLRLPRMARGARTRRSIRRHDRRL
jgi:hypothetical protein